MYFEKSLYALSPESCKCSIQVFEHEIMCSTLVVFGINP